MRDRPIGIFDSGVGGLTVMSEIVRNLPRENIIYFGDTLRHPYGPRPLSEVRSFVFEITKHLVERGVKLVIIACNTATAAGLIEAQRHFDVPVVGVIEPGARGAVMVTKNRRVGVIGTTGTINSGAYSKAVRALDAGVTVYSAPCPKFVEIVEKGLVSDANFTSPKTYAVAKGYLTPLIRADIDALVLGCTHYPLLKGLLSKVCGEKIALISSAEETADEVGTILERKDELRQAATSPVFSYITTGDPEQFRTIGSRFLGLPIAHVEGIGAAAAAAGTSVEGRLG